ncbi:Mitochondrial protein import protein ZIM17 [Picochlorum sp. SENEW3]|nr:Mitochondrial protein import protein ZIM17 [Picochlorum sp. SENEW3]
MHALSISTLPLESRRSEAGKPAACYLRDSTCRLAVTALRRVPPRKNQQGGHSSPCSQYFCGSSLLRRRLLCIVRANGDDDDATVQGNSASIDLNLPRRSMLVSFTCNACGGRSERLVNPLAWEKGMVIVQCEHCKAWHKVADANNMVEEYRFDEMQDSDAE